MIDIRVLDLIGATCVALEDGVKLGDRVRAALESSDTVCLDFTGVTMLTASFLTPAVGGLYAFFSPGDLARRLLWKGLDATDEAVLRLAQRSAIRFLSATPAQQEALLAAEARRFEA